MSWDALPAEVVAVILRARRAAMAAELCARERARRARDARLWPLGVDPRPVAVDLAPVRRWCSACADGGHAWTRDVEARRALLPCQVCHRAMPPAPHDAPSHPGRFCSAECFRFV
jgi:hypothetical protein